ncbi:hypothetical protein AURDEDRAFT_116329 [Auricularia subglabra TFB-10046 SS5]|nr:hypothetical protein AURDEDRAFT_116329 [Auricularia subglabra TFB-10046 SS5]
MAPPGPKHPRVGVGAFVFNGKGEFLLGLRKGSHGAGTWALPGGHLEFGESFEVCAARETLEETGLQSKDVRFLSATNNLLPESDAHYVTVFTTAKVDGSGGKTEPEICEPEKCEKWEWITWEDLETWTTDHRAGRPESRRIFIPLLDLLIQRPDINLSTYA